MSLFVNGTLINYYFHCKRQCWLHGNKVNLEDNSDLVKIGKALHEQKLSDKKDTEISIENIKVDKIKNKVLTEYKKSDADPKASCYQLLYYLKVLKMKGIFVKGKVIFMEKKNSTSKSIDLRLTSGAERAIEKIEIEIEDLIQTDKPPIFKKKKTCSKCAYKDYCFL